MDPIERVGPRLAVVGALAVAVVGLFIVQVIGAVRSAEKMVGVGLDVDIAGRLLVFGVVDQGPAEVAGLRSGDQIVAIDGRQIGGFSDYDAVADGFSGNQPVTYSIVRDGLSDDVVVRPGMPVGWLTYMVRVLVLASCLGMAWYLARQVAVGGLGRLVSLFSLLLAFELAIPRHVVGSVALNVATWSLFYLSTGFQISVALHLASVVPEPHPWLRRRPWWVPLFYFVGGGLGVLACATNVVEELWSDSLLPWSAAESETLLLDIALPLWAVVLVAILSIPVRTHPERRGRLQAGLVLAGILPLAGYDLAWTVYSLLGGEFPDWTWTGDLAPLMILMFPLAVFVAIFHSHLFDLEWVARRGLLYSTLTTSLIILFYAITGAGGAVASEVVETGDHSVWVIVATMLVLAVLTSPLRSALQRVVDQRLLPDRALSSQRLIRLAGELLAFRDPVEIADHLVERLPPLLAAGHATLLLVDEPTRSLRLAASSAVTPPEAIDVVPLEAPGLEALWVSPRVRSFAELCLALPGVRGAVDGLAGALCAPLVGNRPVGLLLLARGSSRVSFGSEAVELLEAFARQAASAFEQAELVRSAKIEGLTGVLRREAVTEYLEREVERARRYDRPLALALVDLDRFKEVNDTFGHLAGDLVLQMVAGELSSRLRHSDAVGRFGGDEFLMVFPETGREAALGLARELQTRVGSRAVLLPDGREVRQAISVGVAALAPGSVSLGPGEARRGSGPDVGAEVRQLLDAADRGLYAEKRARRADRLVAPV